MGIAGRTGAGAGKWVEKDLIWRRQKPAFLREDGSRAMGGGAGGSVARSVGRIGAEAREGGGIGPETKDWVGGMPGIE